MEAFTIDAGRLSHESPRAASADGSGAAGKIKIKLVFQKLE
jgi:hypothetical protein